MLLRFNMEKLKELMRDVHILTKMKVALFDNEFREILIYPDRNTDFCKILRSHEEAEKKCKACDRNAFELCRSSGKLHIYQCHIGLVEVAAPIKMNNVILGYIMYGQVLENKDKASEKNRILKNCEEYRLNEEKLSSAFDKLIYRNHDQIKAASKILESCACYLWISEVVKVDEEQLFYKIDKYIDEHLSDESDEINSKTLCSHFSVSRSRLYEISDQYFGMGIAEYIKKKRLRKAALLLSEQDLTVSEVSELVGISDYNYFSKVFKKELGMTPRAYKKEHRNKM